MWHPSLGRAVSVAFLFLATMAAATWAQTPSESTSEKLAALPAILDEPKFVDPAGLMPEKLAAVATADFSGKSLGELVDWLQDQQKLVVILEKSALAEIEVFPTDPVTDRLDNAPIYLLLDRLRFHGLAWYFRDDILHITSPEVAEQHPVTIPYNLGDLLDAGYDAEDLHDVIRSTIAPDSWDEVGGEGAVKLLGDVMFVRQTDDVQREIQGLFAALRKHARQTFICDPPQHAVLREKLAAAVTVDFQDTPLEEAVAKLAAACGADIRLDVPALREIRVREREPVTLKLADRKLETVLQAVFLDLKLTWLLQHGVLWVTTPEKAASLLKTAVYDVRDLCADQAESEALLQAIMEQTDPSAWDEVGGPGSLQFARPGTLVVRQHESVQVELLGLLEAYRTALRASKPRDRHALDPNEVTTVYYRMNAAMADDLVTVLPKLVQPDSWKSESHPDGQGEILRVASPPELFNREGQLAASAAKGSPAGDATVVVSRAVLVIRQTRAAHEKIAEVIRRVETGDSPATTGGMGGMGGMGGTGGGGFGGMF